MVALTISTRLPRLLSLLLDSQNPRRARASGRSQGVYFSYPSLSITMLRNELPFQMAVFTQAFLWMTTTAVAFYCIRRRNFREHRHWMIRSYAITLIFVTNRALDAIPGMSDLDTDASPNLVWLCNIIAWVVPTFIISWPNIAQSPVDKTTSAYRLP